MPNLYKPCKGAGIYTKKAHHIKYIAGYTNDNKIVKRAAFYTFEEAKEWLDKQLGL